jgi:predicted glycosyltransferase
MKGLIFSEGNGYGHAARDGLISKYFGFPIMTFGKGAEYCKKNDIELIEIPTPYEIKSKKDIVEIVTSPTGLAKFLKPGTLAKIRYEFLKVDYIIVDGSPLGLAIAALVGKPTIYITNDTAALVGVRGTIQRKVAFSFLKTILKYTKSIIVPDFPPPLSITTLNLDSSLPLVFAGPFIKKPKQVRHKKKYVVVGPMENAIRSILGDAAVYGSEVDDPRQFYSDAELIISHGGHTTIMEALSYGKPIICIVNPNYSERVNNAMMLERRDVGIMLDERTLCRETLVCAIELAPTLNRNRLALYKRTAEKLDSLKTVERQIIANVL